MKLRNAACLATLLSTAAPAGEPEPDLTGRPSPGAGPTEVKVRVAVIDLDDINGASQSFTANVAFSARWSDPRLSHDGAEAKTVPLSKIWHPRLQIVNRQRLQSTFPDEVRISPEGEVTYTQRVWGNFSQPLVLNDFPFDHQLLRIDLVAAGYRDHQVVLTDDPGDPSVVGDSLSISDWTVAGWEGSSKSLALTKGSPKLPAFRFSVEVQRNYGYYLVNVIIPLVMIIFMSWVVFWIKPGNSGPRISVSVTAMLTLVAYRFAVGASLPKISYLTRMDWFILGSSLLVFVALLEVVITSRLVDNDRAETARTINRWMRRCAPVAFALIAFLSLS